MSAKSPDWYKYEWTMDIMNPLDHKRSVGS